MVTHLALPMPQHLIVPLVLFLPNVVKIYIEFLIFNSVIAMYFANKISDTYGLTLDSISVLADILGQV